MQGLPRKVSVSLLLLVFGLSVYRARRQFFTVDEAFAFHLFVNKDLSEMARAFDACNHVLHTLLTKLFRYLLGVSEFELRISSLIGCGVYLTAVYKVSRLSFGDRWAQVLAVSGLTLSPLILDFMVAARGYGLALGLLLWAVYLAMVFWVRGQHREYLWYAGVCAGLAVAANLTFAVPVAALGLVMLWMGAREGHGGVWRVVDSYGGPALVMAFVITAIPLLRATSQSFYYGLPSLRDSLYVLAHQALVKSVDRPLTMTIDRFFPYLDRVLIPVLFFALVAIFVVAAYRFIKLPEPLPYRLVPFLLVGGSLIVSAVLIFVLRQFGVLYPLGRTGLYLIPLFMFSLVSGGRLLAGSGRWRHPRWLLSGSALLLVCICLTQLDTRFFSEWRYDSTGMMLRRMQDNYLQKWHEDRKPVIAVSGILQHTVEYYRLRRKMQWMGPLVTQQLDATPADYYLLLREDVALAGRLGLEVLVDDRLSETVLARRRQ